MPGTEDPQSTVKIKSIYGNYYICNTSTMFEFHCLYCELGILFWGDK